MLRTLLCQFLQIFLDEETRLFFVSLVKVVEQIHERSSNSYSGLKEQGRVLCVKRTRSLSRTNSINFSKETNCFEFGQYLPI